MPRPSNKYLIKTCVCCNKVFETKFGSTQFCSSICKKQFVRTCKLCGAPALKKNGESTKGLFCYKCYYIKAMEYKKLHGNKRPHYVPYGEDHLSLDECLNWIVETNRNGGWVTLYGISKLIQVHHTVSGRCHDGQKTSHQIMLMWQDVLEWMTKKLKKMNVNNNQKEHA